MNPPLVMMKVIAGERPIYPSGTEEIGFVAPMWNMTVDCWRHDPVSRPTMPTVVEFLREWSVVSPCRPNPPAQILAAIPNTLRIRLCPSYLRGGQPGILPAHRFMDPSHQRPQMVTSVRPGRRAPHPTPPFQPRNNIRARPLTFCPPGFSMVPPLRLASRLALKFLPALPQVIISVLHDFSPPKFSDEPLL